jgi:hypothetical protein
LKTLICDEIHQFNRQEREAMDAEAAAMRAQISLLQAALKDLNLELEQALNVQDLPALNLRRDPISSLSHSQAKNRAAASCQASSLEDSGAQMPDFSSDDEDSRQAEAACLIEEGQRTDTLSARQLKMENARLVRQVSAAEREKQRVSITRHAARFSSRMRSRQLNSF